MIGRAFHRLARWLAENDPGAVERWRALHFGLALAITIAAAQATDAALGLGLPLRFPMFAGLSASIVLSMLAPSWPRTELVDMLRLAAVVVGYILLVAAADPAALPAGDVLLKLFLVPLIFVALYARRYGPSGQQLGNAAVITALIVSTADPDRRQALLLAAGAAEGAAIAVVLRLALRRRAALPGMGTAVAAFRAELAATVGRIGDALATGDAPAATLLDRLDGELRAVRSSATAALREAPAERDLIDAAKALVYRITVALGLARERLADVGDDRDVAADGGLLDAVRALERWLRAPVAARPVEASRLRAAIAAARDHALGRLGSAGTHRDAMLLAVAGLQRIGAADAELAALEARTAQPLRARPADAAPAAPPTGLLPTTRVALQGLAATVATTALDLAVDLDHAYWATLTVAFVLGGSFGETVGRIRGRLVGTVVGVAVGIAVLGAVGNALLPIEALAILAAMLAVVTLRTRPDVAAAAVAFAIILGLHLITGLGIAGMLARVYETAIGAGAAFLAARFVLPVYLSDPTQQQVAAVFARWREALTHWWPALDGGGEPASRIAADSAALLERLPMLNAESVLGRRGAGDLVRLGTFIDVVASYMTMIEPTAARLRVAGTTEASRRACEQLHAAAVAAFDAVLAGRPPPEQRALPPSPATPRENDPRAVQYLVEYIFLIEALTRTLALIQQMMPTAGADEARPGAGRPSGRVLAILALCVAAALAAMGPSPARAETAAPAPLSGWDWMIGGGLPAKPPRVAYLGLDAFDAPKSFVAAARRNGTHTWCYISVGTIEDWRPDLAEFEALDRAERQAGRPAIIGRPYGDWPGERWLNVSRFRVFLPLLGERMALCRDKGFDMVEFDNLDAYQHRTGFRITRAQTIAFAKALAATARDHGLEPIQKNVPELVGALEPHFAALLFEDCVLYDFCPGGRRFVAAGKPVFDAEYPQAWRDEGRRFDRRAACATAAKAGVDLIVKKLSLGAWVRRCG